MQGRQRQIADAAWSAVAGTRADVAAELGFCRAVFGKLPPGRVKDQYAEIAAGQVSRLAELDDELSALSSVRDELIAAEAQSIEPQTVIIGAPSTANGGAS